MIGYCRRIRYEKQHVKTGTQRCTWRVPEARRRLECQTRYYIYVRDGRRKDSGKKPDASVICPVGRGLLYYVSRTKRE